MLDQATLKTLVQYDPDTGIFIRLSGRKQGQRVGSETTAGNGHRYRRISFTIDHCRYRYYEHRLAYLYMRGVWPLMIDHIDGDGTNNKWSNLRTCTAQTNQWNIRLPRRNTSGHIGVYRDGDRWRAMMTVNGSLRHFGRFKKIEDAVIARIRAEDIFRGGIRFQG